MSTPFGYYVANDILNQLTRAKEIVTKHDADRVYIVTGRERYGKSTLAMQLGHVLDNNLNIDNIVFSPEEMEKRIRKAEQHSVVIYDEAYLGMSASGSLSKQNKRIKKILQECGQRNLFIFLVLPSFFLLEKYPAIFRSHALFNVLVSKKDYSRRHYKAYNYSQKRILYLRGKKLMDMNAIKNPISYRFYGKYPPSIDKEEYIEKKRKSFEKNKEMFEETIDIYGKRNMLFYIMNKKLGIPQVEIAKLIKGTNVEISRNEICTVVGNVSRKVERHR